ncbi:MAG: dienelactone hydrolase [Proteobacteria bacterium]|nr:dienelactone hydrolase [Pseudomonadota bacterium]MBU1449440.1 dienelactone hydrolase [Pseudomonadota bacterium]MBU2467403.1 dienelactone hydrolase [Pseudomonadota bacterium]MBU2516275.1 dienelactone hydrolase [Pseudomonadota bacterium]
MLETSHQRRELDLGGHMLTIDLLLPSRPRGGVVLAHGRVDDLDHPSLKAAAQGAARQGWAALRFNFPYRQQGRKEPDSFAVLLQSHLAACGWLAGQLPQGAPLVPAGKSQGSRTALAVLEHLPAAGVILLGYPLHGSRSRRPRPGEPLALLRLPLLMVQGRRDPLARPEVLEPLLAGLPGPVRFWLVPGGSHSFAVPGGPRRQEEVWGKLGREVESFLAGLAPAGQKAVE